MATNTKPIRSVAQIKSEIKSYKEKMQAEREASKTNPHLEELRHLVSQAEQGRINGITDKLKSVIASMEESPLVLKVGPEVFEYVNSDDYHTYLAEPCGALGLSDAVNRANEVIQAVNILLFLLHNPEEKAEDYKDWILEKASGAMFWVCEYLEEVSARQHMPVEDAALCALAGESFASFNKKV